MKIAAIVLRTLMGLLFIFASATYLFKLMTPPPMTGAMKTFNDGMEAATPTNPCSDHRNQADHSNRRYAHGRS